MEFASGRWAPKVEAACRFVERTGGLAGSARSATRRRSPSGRDALVRAKESRRRGAREHGSVHVPSADDADAAVVAPSAAASASAPAPSATTCARVASRRTASAVSSSGPRPPRRRARCARSHISGMSERPPAPSTHDGRYSISCARRDRATRRAARPSPARRSRLAPRGAEPSARLRSRRSGRRRPTGSRPCRTPARPRRARGRSSVAGHYGLVRDGMDEQAVDALASPSSIACHHSSCGTRSPRPRAPRRGRASRAARRRERSRGSGHRPRAPPTPLPAPCSRARGDDALGELAAEAARTAESPPRSL